MACKYSARRRAALRFLVLSAVLGPVAYLAFGFLSAMLLGLLDGSGTAEVPGLQPDSSPPELTPDWKSWAIIGSGFAGMCFVNYLLFLSGAKRAQAAIEDREQ